MGPGFCYLCRAADKDSAHLFIHYQFSKVTWISCLKALNLNMDWKEQNINDCMENWIQNKAAPKKLFALICWFLWKERNKAIFEGKFPSTGVITFRTLNLLSYNQTELRPRILRLSPITHINVYTPTFFDGASINGGATCGARGILKKLNTPKVKIGRAHV